MRGTGAVSPSVISAVSSGAHPPNSAATRAVAAAGSAKSMAATHSAGRVSSTYDTDRTAFLGTVAARWAQLDPAEYPFVHQMASQLPRHDDREQYLAGIDLILAGIGTI